MALWHGPSVRPTDLPDPIQTSSLRSRLVVLGLVVAGFASGNAEAGAVVLFLAAIGGLVYLALIRMGLKFCYALVRMSDDIHSRR